MQVLHPNARGQKRGGGGEGGGSGCLKECWRRFDSMPSACAIAKTKREITLHRIETKALQFNQERKISSVRLQRYKRKYV